MMAGKRAVRPCVHAGACMRAGGWWGRGLHVHAGAQPCELACPNHCHPPVTGSVASHPRSLLWPHTPHSVPTTLTQPLPPACHWFGGVFPPAPSINGTHRTHSTPAPPPACHRVGGVPLEALVGERLGLQILLQPLETLLWRDVVRVGCRAVGCVGSTTAPAGELPGMLRFPAHMARNIFS